MTRLCAGRTINVFWICLRLLGQAQAQWCYYPGGEDKALQQIPCDAYAYTTLCCPLGWTCFSNNLCVVTDETAVGNAFPVGTALRGTCTNPSWNDTACGDFCLDDTGSPNNGSLQNCGGGNWCCQSSVDAGSCDCGTGEGTFSIPDGTASTIIGVTGLGSTNTIPQAASTSSALQTTSSTSPLTTSKITIVPTSKTASTASTAKTTSTPSTLLTSSALSSHTSPSPTSHTSTPTASSAAATSTHPAVAAIKKPAVEAGIAVAAIFVAFAIAAFCLWFFWYRHRGDNNPNMNEMSDEDYDAHMPEPNSAVPGPILLRPNPDPYEYRAVNDGLRLSPVSERGNSRNSMWSGGHNAGFAGRTTDERIRPVVDPYRMPYEGT